MNNKYWGRFIHFMLDCRFRTLQVYLNGLVAWLIFSSFRRLVGWIQLSYLGMVVLGGASVGRKWEIFLIWVAVPHLNDWRQQRFRKLDWRARKLFACLSLKNVTVSKRYLQVVFFPTSGKKKKKIPLLICRNLLWTGLAILRLATKDPDLFKYCYSW